MQEKVANYSDCNSQFFTGFATMVVFNITSYTMLHLVCTYTWSLAPTTLLQRLYNNWIQKHNIITIFQLAIQITTIALEHQCCISYNVT